MKGELHIVRTDVLLWALGGMAKPKYAGLKRRWSSTEIKKLLSYYREHSTDGKLWNGSGAELCRFFPEHSRQQIYYRIHVLRKAGVIEPAKGGGGSPNPKNYYQRRVDLTNERPMRISSRRSTIADPRRQPQGIALRVTKAGANVKFPGG
jgi:hypothetical protein